ncbi:MAG: EAL domain-containing protein, partial [Desulfitobacterium hafniense]|nr:EAL domain-containing protein [Desulfitobacterium hafniense]
MLQTQTHSKQLFKFLDQGYSIWVVYLDIIRFHEIEFRVGYVNAVRILEEIEKEIELKLKEQRHLFLLSVLESRIGDDFVLYFVPDTNTPCSVSQLNEYWVIPLEKQINKKLQSFVNETIRLHSGIVLCENQPGKSSDYLLYTAIKEAFLLNRSEPDPNYFSLREEIAKILNEPYSYLQTAFQPILQVQTGEVFGYEALSRFKGPTSFNNIGELFPFAEKVGQLYPIETICRRLAILSSSKVLNKHNLLFLNINPQVITDPEFASGQTRRLLTQHGLEPSKVVLELTERSAIQDFKTFREALAHYRNQGYLIALDDVGAGYSSLQSVAELHPDFIKIDRSLISKVNIDPIKWALLETFVTFSKRIGCRILAEGVETEEEMRTLVQLGVEYIQGYFLAKPSFEQADINERAIEIVKSYSGIRNLQDTNILTLLEPLPLFSANTLVEEVDRFFRSQPNQWIIGLIDEDRIVGVLQRDKLYSSLGTRYGVALYSGRTVSILMDSNPLIVEDTTPIEVISSLAMSRSNAYLYDGIVVVNQQKAIGMISVAG